MTISKAINAIQASLTVQDLSYIKNISSINIQYMFDIKDIAINVDDTFKSKIKQFKKILKTCKYEKCEYIIRKDIKNIYPLRRDIYLPIDIKLYCVELNNNKKNILLNIKNNNIWYIKEVESYDEIDDFSGGIMFEINFKDNSYISYILEGLLDNNIFDMCECKQGYSSEFKKIMNTQINNSKNVINKIYDYKNILNILNK